MSDRETQRGVAQTLNGNASEDAAPSMNGAGPEGASVAPLDALTAALKLGGGLCVIRAEVHGRGPNARVILGLSDGAALDIERFADVLKPAALEAAVTCATGRIATYKKSEAQKAAALIFEAAEHYEAATERDEARGWGIDFLRRADEVQADLGDQRERWGAFQLLDDLDPIAQSRLDGRAPGAASTVIRDRDGARWIVAAWFAAHVRHIAAGAANLQRLPNLMSAVGWERRGQRGDVKATNPTDPRTIRLRLYRVPEGWEDGAPVPTEGNEQVPAGPHGTAASGPQVPTGTHLRTRAHTRRAGALTGDPWGPEENGDRRGPEQAESQPHVCGCPDPLPAPAADGSIRCTRCGFAASFAAEEDGR